MICWLATFRLDHKLLEGSKGVSYFSVIPHHSSASKMIGMQHNLLNWHSEIRLHREGEGLLLVVTCVWTTGYPCWD